MSVTYYTRMGGESTVRQLLERFYDLMNELETAHELRKRHAADLTVERHKSFMVLYGWLGGSPLSIGKYDHPKLHQRHHCSAWLSRNTTCGCYV